MKPYNDLRTIMDTRGTETNFYNHTNNLYIRQCMEIFKYAIIMEQEVIQ